MKSQWRKNLLADLHINRAKLLGAIAGLPTDAFESPIWDDWSIRRLLPHIALWDAFEAQRLRATVDPNTAQVERIPTDERNDRWHKQHAETPLHVGVAMLLKERNGLLNVIATMSDEQLQKKIEVAPDVEIQVVQAVLNSIEHDADHAKDIKVWREANGYKRHTEGPRDVLVAWSRAGLKAVLSSVHPEPVEVAETIPPDQPIEDNWSLKEIGAHFAGWEQFAHEGLINLKSPPIESTQGFNDEAVASRTDQSLRDSLQAYISTRKANISIIERMTDAELAQPLENPWGWQNSPYKWMLDMSYHDLEHAEELRKS